MAGFRGGRCCGLSLSRAASSISTSTVCGAVAFFGLFSWPAMVARGGGVVDATAVWTRLRRSSGFATSTVASKRRRCAVAAIFGQRNGPAVLDLLARAYSSFARGFLALMRPSPSGFWRPKWFVPGGDRNGRICWLGGGVQGLTCVSRVNTNFSRVQSAFSKGLCVISGAARALSVNLYPPPV